MLSEDNSTPAGVDFGRCERINSCGWHSYPTCTGDAKFEPLKREYEAPKEPSFIPKNIVDYTLVAYFSSNPFFSFLKDILLSESLVIDLIDKYNIGTAKNGGTIFWQQDNEGKFRTGKVMYYRKTGRRNKSRTSWYVHKNIDPEFNLVQVFFGEHLVTKDKPVALCESEKTAIIMSVLMPEYTWIASGGSEMINTYRLSRLPRLDKIYPDDGCLEKWRHKTRIFNPKCDYLVHHAVRNGILKPGSDILDLFMSDAVKLVHERDNK